MGPSPPPLSGALGTQATSAFGSGLLGQRLGTPCGEIHCPTIGGGIKQCFNKWLFKVGFGRNRVLYSLSSHVYSHRSRFSASWCSEVPSACAGRGTWSRDAGTGSTALADVAVAPRVLGSCLACGGARQGSEAFSSLTLAGPAGAQDVGSLRAGARSVWSPLLSGHPGQGTPDVCRALSDRSWNHEARLTPSGRAERPGRTDLGEETFVHGARLARRKHRVGGGVLGKLGAWDPCASGRAGSAASRGQRRRGTGRASRSCLALRSVRPAWHHSLVAWLPWGRLLVAP